MSELINIDIIRCHLIGNSLSNADTIAIQKKSKLNLWQKFWVEFLFVSICHKTNWDVLYRRIYEIAEHNFSLIDKQSLCDMNTNKFHDLFKGYIRKERRWDLDRRNIFKDIGYIARSAHLGNLDIASSGPVMLGGKGGLYEWLNRFKAYADDPMQKKSRVLIHQLLKNEIIAVYDEHNILPAIDYHLIRLYMRTGRVVTKHNSTLQRLQKDQVARVEFQTILRKAVEDAMWYTATGAKMRIDKLNHLEWQIGRSYCLRDNARCDGPYLAEKPVSQQFLKQVDALNGKCPLYMVCGARNDSRLLKVKDPLSVRSYY